MRNSNKIKFFDYVKLLSPYREKLMNQLSLSLEDGIYINGPSVESFESEFAKYTGSKYAIGVSSATDGLVAILLSLGLPKGSDVLVPSYTFIASAEAILTAGLNPVFVDNAPDSFHPTTDQFIEAWTENTKAVMFVHLFGETRSINSIQKLCDERGALLVEDAAESFGSYYPEGGHSGTRSLAAAFSFFPAKTLGCLGDGGIVITDDRETYEKIKMIRAHGSKRRYHHEMVGGNLRLDALQARFLSVLLRDASKEWLSKRQKNANYYFNNIKNPNILLPIPDDTIQNHSWYLYTLVVKERDRLKDYLADANIETAVYWPAPLHKQPIYIDLFGDKSLPECELRCKQVLHIPVSPHLEQKELEKIVKYINEFE